MVDKQIDSTSTSHTVSLEMMDTYYRQTDRRAEKEIQIERQINRQIVQALHIQQGLK